MAVVFNVNISEANNYIEWVKILAPYLIGIIGILSPLFTAKYFKNIELEKYRLQIIENLKIESYKDIYKKLNEVVNLSINIMNESQWNELTNEAKEGFLRMVGLDINSDFEKYKNKMNVIFCNHIDKTVNELMDFSNENIFISKKLRGKVGDINVIKIKLLKGVLKQGVITDPHCFNKIEGKVLECKEIISKEVAWQ